MPHKIKIFHIDDSSLKQLGELLGNETSRTIIKELIDKEYYTNELAKKLDIPVSLVIHHLRKLEELDMVDIKQKKITKKGINRRFFRIRSDMIIAKSTKEEETATMRIKNMFREGTKFCTIGLASVGSYFITSYLQNAVEMWNSSEGRLDVGYSDPIIIALVILILGLVMERILASKKNKKKVAG